MYTERIYYRPYIGRGNFHWFFFFFGSGTLGNPPFLPPQFFWSQSPPKIGIFKWRNFHQKWWVPPTSMGKILLKMIILGCFGGTQMGKSPHQPKNRTLVFFFLGHFRTLRHLRWEKLQMFKFGLRNSWSNELENWQSNSFSNNVDTVSLTYNAERSVFNFISTSEIYDFFRPAVFQNIAPIKMVPVLNVSSQSFSPFLDKNGKIMLQVTILQQIPSITAQFFRNLPGFNLFFPRRRLIWETPPKVSILGAYNTLVGIIVETLHQVFECKPSYLYLHHMETIIQLHTTTSRCIIIQQIFGKTIPKFWESKIPRSSASIKSVFCYHSRPGGWCLPKVSTAEFWVASKNPFRNGATHTHHTRQTLAQGRLEERHDKAGRTPDYAEPSLLLYDAFFVYSGVPLRDAEQTFGTFSNMSPVSLVAFTTSSGLRE